MLDREKVLDALGPQLVSGAAGDLGEALEAVVLGHFVASVTLFQASQTVLLDLFILIVASLGGPLLVRRRLRF